MDLFTATLLSVSCSETEKLSSVRRTSLKKIENPNQALRCFTGRKNELLLVMYGWWMGNEGWYCYLYLLFSFLRGPKTVIVS